MTIAFNMAVMNAEVIKYVADRIGSTPDKMAPAAGIAIMRDDKIVGGLVYNNFHRLEKGSWCEISAATDDPGCLTRAVIREMFGFPFNHLGVNRLKAECAETNARVRSALTRLGFTFEGIARRAYDGETSSVVFSMLPEECRWIRE